MQKFTHLPVTCHTRHVGPGSTFVAIKGMKEDGVSYIQHAIAAGAKTLVIDEHAQLSEDTQQLIKQQHITLIRVTNTRLALAQLSAQAHNFPARSLRMIGITGTKGKSTTTFLLAHIVRTAGHKTAFLSTVHNAIDDVPYVTELTTQQPDYLHAFLRQAVDCGVTYVVMEVAAQAVTLERVAGIEFDALLFLNFSHEHGEFYALQDDYFQAKAALFKQLKPVVGCAILPQDNLRISNVIQDQKRFFSKPKQYRSSLSTGISFSYQDYQYTCPALIGEFNLENICAAITAARTMHISQATIAQALLTFSGVPGRLTKYSLPNGASAYIDYAHNPASFDRVLHTMRSYAKHLIVLFGAGGDRDHAKRPLMGQIASHYADVVIVTTDNPRSENPETIIQEICRGIEEKDKYKLYIIADRAQAISKAYELSHAESVIMLLGKGPDEYQIIGHEKSYFSEREILQSF